MLKLAGFNSTIYSFNKKTGVSFTPKTPRPIDRTPGTPGSGKNEVSFDQFVSEPVTMINAGDASASSEKRLKPVLQGRI